VLLLLTEMGVPYTEVRARVRVRVRVRVS